MGGGVDSVALILKSHGVGGPQEIASSNRDTARAVKPEPNPGRVPSSPCLCRLPPFSIRKRPWDGVGNVIS